MNTIVIGRIAWKEYRQQIAFFIAMLVLAVLLQVIVAWMTYYSAIVPLNLRLTIVGGFAALFAAASGATIYSTEKEVGTFQNLQLLPISSNQLLVGKLIAPLIFCLGFLLIASIATLALYWWDVGATLKFGASSYTEPKLVFLFLFFGLAVLEFFTWGWFFSLISRQPLVAALLGIFSASAAVHLVVVLSSRATYDAFAIEPYADVWMWRLVVVGLVLLANVSIAGRWLEGHEIVKWPLKNPPGPPLKKGGNATGAGVRRNRGRAKTTSIFGRLVWQTVRTSWPQMLVYVGSVVVAIAVGTASDIDRFLWLGTILGLFASCLAGVFVFVNDHRGSAYRFLGQRGERPALIWLSRVLTWGVLVFAVNVVGWVICFLGISLGQMEVLFSGQMPFWKSMALVIPEGFGAELGSLWIVVLFACSWSACSLVVFCAGQFASILCRSSVIAGIVGMILGGLTIGWCALILISATPFVWTVLPVGVGFLLASWLHAAPWLSEKQGWGALAVPWAVVLAISATVVSGTIWHRSTEIPSAQVEFARDGEPDEQVFEEIRNRLGAAMEGYSRPDDNVASSVKFWVTGNGMSANDEERMHRHFQLLEHIDFPIQQQIDLARTYLAENQTVIEQYWSILDYAHANVEQFYRLEPSVPGILINPSAPFLGGVPDELLKLQFEFDLKDGRPERAWKGLRALIQLRYLRSLEFPSFNDSWKSFEFRDIGRWALGEGQTRDLLMEAMEFVKDDQWLFAGTERIVEADYLAMAAMIERGSLGPGTDFQSLVLTLLPWERKRALNLIRLSTLATLDTVEDYGYYWQTEKFPPPRRRPLAERVGVKRLNWDQWALSTAWPANNSVGIAAYNNRYMGLGEALYHRRLELETMKDLVVLKLAVLARRAETGKFPASLDDLVGDLIDEVPHYETGQIFDPETGNSKPVFRPKYYYFPNGIALRVSDRRNATNFETVIPANTPFIANREIDRAVGWATLVDRKAWDGTSQVEIDEQVGVFLYNSPGLFLGVSGQSWREVYFVLLK